MQIDVIFINYLLSRKVSKIQPIRVRVSNVVCRNQIFQIEAGKFCAQSFRDLIRWNPAKD